MTTPGHHRETAQAAAPTRLSAGTHTDPRGEALAAARHSDAEYREGQRPLLEKRLRRHERFWMPLLHTALTVGLTFLLGTPYRNFIAGERNRFIPQDPTQRMEYPLAWTACLIGGLMAILFILTVANAILEFAGEQYRDRLHHQLGKPVDHPGTS